MSQIPCVPECGAQRPHPLSITQDWANGRQVGSRRMTQRPLCSRHPMITRLFVPRFNIFRFHALASRMVEGLNYIVGRSFTLDVADEFAPFFPVLSAFRTCTLGSSVFIILICLAS
jgi:hypothetical protein